MFIFNELINTLRVTVTDKKAGISCFIQCIMPNAAGRIKQSSIDNMVKILLTTTIMYKDADHHKHPKIYVVFNDVSVNPQLNSKESDYNTD